MKRKSTVLLFLVGVFLLAPLAAWAEQWVFLGKHELGNMYLDKDSVMKKGDLVIYWVKRQYFKEQQSKGKWKYSEQRVQHEVDCAKRTITFTGMEFRDAKGKIVAHSGVMHQGPKPIDPTGFITKEADMVCLESAKAPAGDKKALAKKQKDL